MNNLQLKFPQGGVIDKADTEIRNHLDRLIDFWSKQLPDPTRAAEDLMRFAKMNDRRNYSLIQFCIAEASDYKKIHRSIVSEVCPLSISSGLMHNRKNYKNGLTGYQRQPEHYHKP